MPKHQRQNNQIQITCIATPDPSGIDNTETSEKQTNHIHCESTDDKKENESTIDINKLKIEHYNEIAIEPNHYQKEDPRSNLHKSHIDQTAKMKDFPRMIENQTNMNNMNQNVTSESFPPRSWNSFSN